VNLKVELLVASKDEHDASQSAAMNTTMARTTLTAGAAQVLATTYRYVPASGLSKLQVVRRNLVALTL